MRAFPDYIEKAAAKCALHTFTDEPFTSNGGPVGGGGTTAVQVTMNESGLLAWAKPARDNPADANCAAHEKIASDLAMRLELPVPPVILSRHGATLGMAKVVSLSYEGLPQGRPWGQLANRLTSEMRAQIRPAMSAMWVFHAWLNDSDHNWNDGNILVEIDGDGAVALAFIDYSFALTKYWDPPGAPNSRFDWDRESQNYGPWDRDAMREILGRIDKLSSTDFATITGRLPEDCMGKDLASRLAEGLDRRRKEIPSILKL